MTHIWIRGGRRGPASTPRWLDHFVVIRSAFQTYPLILYRKSLIRSVSKYNLVSSNLKPTSILYLPNSKSSLDNLLTFPQPYTSHLSCSWTLSLNRRLPDISTPHIFGHLGTLFCSAEVTVFFPLWRGEVKVAEGTEEAPPPSANDSDRFTKTRPGWRVVEQIATARPFFALLTPFLWSFQWYVNTHDCLKHCIPLFL